MPTHAQPPRSKNFHPSDPVAVNELRASAKSKKAIPLDVLALIFLVGGGNFLLAKADPGWLSLNPSPWLLVPIYVGARHGILPGLTASVATTAAILAWRFLALQEMPAVLPQTAPVFFGGILIVGQIAGLAHKVVSGRMRRLQDFALEAGRENLRLAEEIAIFRENEASLQESLLLHGAEYTALTEELGQLFADEDCDLEAGLLELFHQHLGVTASAIFWQSEEDDSSPTAPFLLTTRRGGDESLIPECFAAADSRMIDAAIKSGKIVTASQLLADPESEKLEPILAVIPWGEDPGKTDAICIIYRMAFDRVSWETLGRIEAIFDWTMARRALHSTEGAVAADDVTAKIYAPAPFRRQIEKAQQAEKTLHIASRLIIFAPNSDKLTAENQKKFISELQQTIRVTDSIGSIVSLRGDYAIGVLSRFSTDKAAELYASRLRELSGVDGISFQVYDLFNSALEKSLTEAEEREAAAERRNSNTETAPIPTTAEPAR